MKPLSESKRKELDTRHKLGPRLGRSPKAPYTPTAPPTTGGRRRVYGSSSRAHPTTDSGA